MIRDIARKEFICLIRDGRFKWAIVIMLLLLMTSFLTGYQRYQSLHSIQEASQARDNEQWLSQDKKNPHTAARSEEHTSELQSLMRISYAVFCLKKKKRKPKHKSTHITNK